MAQDNERASAALSEVHANTIRLDKPVGDLTHAWIGLPMQSPSGLSRVRRSPARGRHCATFLTRCWLARMFVLLFLSDAVSPRSAEARVLVPDS